MREQEEPAKSSCHGIFGRAVFWPTASAPPAARRAFVPPLTGFFEVRIGVMSHSALCREEEVSRDDNLTSRAARGRCPRPRAAFNQPRGMRSFLHGQQHRIQPLVDRGTATGRRRVWGNVTAGHGLEVVYERLFECRRLVWHHHGLGQRRHHCRQRKMCLSVASFHRSRRRFWPDVQNKPGQNADTRFLIEAGFGFSHFLSRRDGRRRIGPLEGQMWRAAHTLR